MDHIGNITQVIQNKLASGEIRTFTGFDCDDCHNSGFRMVDDPSDRVYGGRYQGAVRCDRCRYWEFVRDRLRK